MKDLSLSRFGDRVNEIMPFIMREFLKNQMRDFYKVKLTLPQFAVMGLLAKEKEARMTDLARFVNVTTAAMTGIADRLVRSGYAARFSDPKDRRTVKIRLTPKGAKTIKDSIGQRKKMTMKIFGMISQEEREKYLEILNHIKDHLQEKEGR